MKTAVPHKTDPTHGPSEDARPGEPERPGWPARAVLLTTAGALALLVAAFFLFNGGSDGPAASDTPLELSLGQSDALASCMPLDPAILAGMAPAFAATPTSVDGETITLAVDRWYAGGDASTVILHAPAGLEALIGGVDFQVGQPYLITASEGIVNYCGFSGPATPELQSAFDAAFPG